MVFCFCFVPRNDSLLFLGLLSLIYKEHTSIRTKDYKQKTINFLKHLYIVTYFRTCNNSWLVFFFVFFEEAFLENQ